MIPSNNCSVDHSVSVRLTDRLDGQFCLRHVTPVAVYLIGPRGQTDERPTDRPVDLLYRSLSSACAQHLCVSAHALTLLLLPPVCARSAAAVIFLLTTPTFSGHSLPVHGGRLLRVQRASGAVVRCPLSTDRPISRPPARCPGRSP